MSLKRSLFLLLYINIGYLMYLILTNTSRKMWMYNDSDPEEIALLSKDSKAKQDSEMHLHAYINQDRKALYQKENKESMGDYEQHRLEKKDKLDYDFHQQQDAYEEVYETDQGSYNQDGHSQTQPQFSQGKEFVSQEVEQDIIENSKAQKESDMWKQHFEYQDSQKGNLERGLSLNDHQEHQNIQGGNLMDNDKEQVLSKVQLDSGDNVKQIVKSNMDINHLAALNKHRFKPCRGLKRPNIADVPKINNMWQYFMVNHTRTNVVAMYYDNRSLVSEPCLHGYAALVCPIDEVPQGLDYHALLWYQGMDEPIPVICWTKTKTFEVNWWKTDNMNHGITEFRCFLPYKDHIPTHVSLSDKPCHLQSNLLEVVLPEPPVNGQRKPVTACVKCLFGNLTESYAPFLVSWMESMKLFGMPEIYMDEDVLYMAPVVERIFKYYKDTKFLYMRKFPNNLYETPVPKVDAPLSQSVVMPVSNDCFYRNLNKYDYILHIDYDEILVPRRHNTYVELISEFLQNNTQYINSSSLAARSAPFYMYLEKGNPEAPDYAPILQYTNRKPPIIPGKDGISPTSAGVRKTFINTRTCTMLFIHGCHGWVPGYYVKGSGAYFSVEDMLVHHYRKTCKQNPRNTGICPPNDYYGINDKILWDKFGPKLSERIKAVLLKVGYL